MKRKIITYIKSILIGIVFGVAVLLWLYSSGKIMDFCICVGTLAAITGISTI